MIKKTFLRLFATIVPLLALCPDAAMPYISVDAGTGRILAHQDAFDRWYPASLTKIMTAYIAFQTLQAGKINLATPVTISAFASRVPPSRSGYQPGSVLTLDSALKIMLVKSANDIATAIGETIGGSQTRFVRRMNEEARRIGMIDTHFANANGLPDSENYSTARDMAVLAVQIRREFPQYAHYFEIPAIDFGEGRKIYPNPNNLIGRYSGADGMKTGFICASGFNLAASATRSGRTIIVIVLGAERIDVREALAARLLTEGFKSQGSPQTTLATLRPYGAGHLEAPNLREQICNAEAWQVRVRLRDENGQIIINSPFIKALQRDPPAVSVRLLSEPPRKAKKAAAPARKVPLPQNRPSHHQ